MAEMHELLEAAARKHGVGGYRRHVLLCTGPKCCTEAEGMAAWEALKGQIKDHHLGEGDRCGRRTGNARSRSDRGQLRRPWPHPATG